VRGSAPTGLIARAVVVLRQLAAARQPMSLTQIAHATTLPKSTVHRILAALAAAGATTRTPTGHTLSREWSELLHLTGGPGHGVLRRLLTPHVVDLHTATGLVCDLAVREDGDVLFLACVYGHDYRAGLARLPERAPAHCTAAGQVLLAFDPGGLEALSGRPLAAVTDRTITDLGQLQHRLAEIRANGIAISRGERVAGTVGLAAAVIGRTGAAECALTVGGPVDRVEIGPVAAQLRRVAHAASITLRTSR
jgi:DNA-binding IclR family transcriptional regulator